MVIIIMGKYIVLVIILLNGSLAFNLDGSPDYMTEKTGGNVYNKDNVPGASAIKTNEIPAFFGYTISVLKNNATGNITLMIGSPLSKNLTSENPDSHSSIHSCTFGNTIFSDETNNCTISYPNDSVPGDGFGMSVAARTDGNALSCAPFRELVCETMKTFPGFCYKSTDYGQTWEKDGETRRLRCPAKTIEVLFVLDGSGSVGRNNFGVVKNWVKTITSGLNLTNGDTTVGVVQFSHYNPNSPINKQEYIVTEIPIGKIKKQSLLEEAIDAIKYARHNTPTGRAMQKVVYDFKGTVNYGKLDNKQVMILLTDGLANKNEKAIVPVAADALRDMGIVTYAVGVGRINRDELQIIANGGKEDDRRVFTVKDFTDLNKIVKELGAEISSGFLEGGGGETTEDLYTAQIGLSNVFSKGSVTGDFGVCSNVSCMCACFVFVFV